MLQPPVLSTPNSGHRNTESTKNHQAPKCGPVFWVPYTGRKNRKRGPSLVPPGPLPQSLPPQTGDQPLPYVSPQIPLAEEGEEGMGGEGRGHPPMGSTPSCGLSFVKHLLKSNLNKTASLIGKKKRKTRLVPAQEGLTT